MTAFATAAEFAGLGADAHHTGSAAELTLLAAVTFVASAVSVAGRAGDRRVNCRRKAGEADEKK